MLLHPLASSLASLLVPPAHHVPGSTPRSLAQVIREHKHQEEEGKDILDKIDDKVKESYNTFILFTTVARQLKLSNAQHRLRIIDNH